LAPSNVGLLPRTWEFVLLGAMDVGIFNIEFMGIFFFSDQADIKRFLSKETDKKTRSSA
jgi:hypothetical protein